MWSAFIWVIVVNVWWTNIIVHYIRFSLVCLYIYYLCRVYNVIMSCLGIMSYLGIMPYLGIMSVIMSYFGPSLNPIEVSVGD